MLGRRRLNLAKDRNKWQAVVKDVINFLVPKKKGEENC